MSSRKSTKNMSLKAVASAKAEKTIVNKIEHDDFEYAINDSQATQDINDLIKDDAKYYDSIVSTDSLSVVSDKLVDGLFRMWLDDNKSVYTTSISLADGFYHVFGQWFSSDKDGEQIFCNKFSHKEKKYAAQVKAIIGEVMSLVAKKIAIAHSTDWIKSYNEYCGDFSDDDSDDKIGEKLVQGLVAFWHHAEDNGGIFEQDCLVNVPNYLLDVLDRWIEHDESVTGVLSIFFDGKQGDRRMELIVDEAIATIDYQASVNAAPKKDFVSKSIKDGPPSEIEKIKSGNGRIASMSSSKSTKNMSSSSSSSSDKTSDKVSKSSSSSSSSSDKPSSKAKKSVLELLTEKISQIVGKVVDDEEIAAVLIDAFSEKANQDDLAKILKANVAKEKKIKKIKDPEAPKGKRTGYIIFCGDERASVKEDYPDMSPKLILTELGARWKALSDKKKAKYTKLAEADKVRYDEEMSGYTPSDEFLEKKSKAEKESASGTKKKRERKAGPKRANSSYIFFCSEFRDKVKAEMEDGSDAKEVTKQLGAVWKNSDDAVMTLSNKDRKRFDKMAAADKERYAEAKANWVDPSSDSDSEKKEKPKPKKSSKSSSDSSDDEESSSSATASDEDKHKKSSKSSSSSSSSDDEDKPKSDKKDVLAAIAQLRRVSEAFANFAKKQRKHMSKKEDFADKTTEQVTAEIEEKWSGLSKEKRESYAKTE